MKKTRIFSIFIAVVAIALMSVGMTYTWIGGVSGGGISRPIAYSQTMNGYTNFNNTIFQNSPTCFGNEITVSNPHRGIYTISGNSPFVIDTQTVISTSKTIDTLVLSYSNFLPGQVIRILSFGKTDSTIITTPGGLINNATSKYFVDSTSTYRSITIYYTGSNTKDFFILK